MIKRDLTDHLIESARQFSAVALTGPRQSGKTTLVQAVFKNHSYVSLEDFDKRAQAHADPRLFLQNHSNKFGIILDEIQHVPELLSYIQTIIDREKKKGYFIITGSQNLLVNQAISQTLAGRIAWLTLFPLSINELQQASLLTENLNEFVFKGCYPRIYDEDVAPAKLHEYYIRGYIERDVRQVKNIFDLHQFQIFLQLCAGRIGQILNITSLSNDSGIDQKTVKSWLSILEATHIIFLLNPYYKKLGKRLVKSQKIYFIDTGIACSLLTIKNQQELSNHFNWGGLVESCIISDLYKQFYNFNQKPSLYFWRNHQGNEIDVILEQALTLTPIEIKAGKTVNPDFFKQLLYLKQIKRLHTSNPCVIYGGTENQNWPEAQVLGWQNSGTLIKKLIG